MYDLHLHSLCSDGDLAPEAVVRAAYDKGLTGLALTDHNGIWGIDAAAEQAHKNGLEFLSGIELSTNFNNQDVHMLGFATTFKAQILEEGLAKTKQGCRERIEAMIKKCHEAGFKNVSMESIEARYAFYKNPSFISFDVARELQEKHSMPLAEAHRMTVAGGECYVPYGDYLLSPTEAIALLHSAGSVAVLAHPGITLAEEGEDVFNDLLKELCNNHIDGIEVRHPFHKPDFVQRLTDYAATHKLLVTAGSDWHGVSRFPENNAQFGACGVTAEEWTRLLTRCAELA